MNITSTVNVTVRIQMICQICTQRGKIWLWSKAQKHLLLPSTLQQQINYDIKDMDANTVKANRLTNNHESSAKEGDRKKNRKIHKKAQQHDEHKD